MSVSVPPLTLSLPDGLHPSHYERVRQAGNLDREILTILQAGGLPDQILSSFSQARAQAIVRLEAITPPADASPATGPGPASVTLRQDFDRVCTDMLRAWFITAAETIATTRAPKDERIAQIRLLQERAREAFPWDPSAGESVSVRVMLVAATVEQG